MAGYNWVLNFANSIVGVGVLAMPYCFYKCGIVLAALMVLCSSIMTKKTCEFLLRTASYTRKTTFEQIALHVYGPMGKLITELSTIGLLLGTLVAFQVVIGDLAPALVRDFTGVQGSWTLRSFLMIVSSGVILPLCFLRIASLASLNAASMAFYSIFIVITICFAFPTLYVSKWLTEVNLWRTESFFNCLPIISIAFTCQTQVFVMYNALPDPNMKTMVDIIDKAISLVASIYIIVGTFGYLAFYESGVHGDVLANFPQGFITNFLKLGFWASVIVSFPLMVFPVRVSINSLLYSQKEKGVLHDVISSASDYIAPDKFMYITVSLVFGTLTVGILVPHIELVLSITGALVGTFLCYVFPALLYLLGCPKDGMRKLAQVIVVVSSIIMIISTTTVLMSVSDHRKLGHVETDQNIGNINAPVPIPAVHQGPIENIKVPGKEIEKKEHVENVNVANDPKVVVNENLKEKDSVNLSENTSENWKIMNMEKREHFIKPGDLPAKSEKIESSLNDKESVNKHLLRHKLSNDVTEPTVKRDILNVLSDKKQNDTPEEKHELPLNTVLLNRVLGNSDHAKETNINEKQILEKKIADLQGSKNKQENITNQVILGAVEDNAKIKLDKNIENKEVEQEKKPGREVLSQ